MPAWGDDFARQMSAERLVKDKNIKLVWELLHRDNHLLDSTANALACVDDSWSPSLRYMLEHRDDGDASAQADEHRGGDAPSVLSQAASRASAILANR